jgi:hypothetical protein
MSVRQAQKARTRKRSTVVAPADWRIGRLADLYRASIVEKGRGESFLIALSYLATAFLIRGITHAIRHQILGLRNISSGGGLHIHHMVFGIIGLLLVGFISAGFRPRRRWARRALAIGFGIAAALTLDEFALWLRLEDVYWSPQGRESVYALFLAGAIALLLFQGLDFWRSLWRDTLWLVSGRRGPLPTPR